jgi:hypothetical protein
MQSFLTAWRFLLLASIFVFPQLLGILLYFRLRWAPRWVAAIACALAPAILFVLLAPIVLFAGIREDATCGMPAFGAILMLYAGAIIHLGLGLFTQIIFIASRRKGSIAAN